MARQVTPKRITLFPDARLENADWTRQTWDIPAKNVKELKVYIKKQGWDVAHFKTLPVYKMNVKKLKWLREL